MIDHDTLERGRVVRRRSIALAALVCSGALAIGCGRIGPLSTPATQSGRANFQTVVALGTSISAGFQSGGLEDRHQLRSFPALLAHQAGAASFTLPTVSPDGLPPLLRLVSLSPPIVTNAGETPGSPTNALQPTPYHNLAVPGAVLFDVTSTVGYGRSGFFTLVLRGQGTMLQEAAALHPTFVTFEFGANEVLGPATSGSGTPLLTGPEFAAVLHATLDSLALAMPGAGVAMLNVPDVTAIPFVTTIPPYLFDPATLRPILIGGQTVPLIGPSGPLSPDDHVLLTAAESLAVGTGIPVPIGNGRPLPDAMVLSASEAASLSAAVTAYDAAIATEAQTRGYALADLAGLLRQASTTGFDIHGVRYTSAYITGGLFSLDGVHPDDLAHALIGNAVIAAVNATYGSRIPPLDLNAAATATSSAMAQARPLRIRGLEPGLRAAFSARR